MKHVILLPKKTVNLDNMLEIDISRKNADKHIVFAVMLGGKTVELKSLDWGSDARKFIRHINEQLAAGESIIDCRGDKYLDS